MTDPHHHHAHADEAGRAHPADEAAMAELLDLDAEVLDSHLAEVITWIGELSAGRPVRRIADLGSGTGTGALALARYFRHADVIAVDMSADLLARAAARAGELGVAGRFRPLQADLDGAWPVTGPIDLAWAANSLHHMADPGHVLAGVFTALRPGGLLVVAEMGAFPRFLPDGSGPGRVEERGHAARAAEMPGLGADWGRRLRQAGFAIAAERSFAIDLRPPLPAAAGRYAQASLRRMRFALEDRLSADDLAVLDALTADDGPGSILRRPDLGVRTSRTVWVAARP